MGACQPQVKTVSEDWADTGGIHSDDHDQSSDSTPPTAPEPDDPTADLDGDMLDAGQNPCRNPVLGRVQEVIDGDTIKVETGRGVERVRLIGIDAPEVDHTGPDDDCYGEEASSFLEGLIDDKMVWLTFDAECDDHYDRTLAYVHTHEAFIQRALLQDGMVSSYRVSPNTSFASLFDSDEDASRLRGAGMWGACR